MISTKLFRIVVVLGLLLGLCFDVVLMFNLDIRSPTVVLSPVDKDIGFGFSLAQHKFSDGQKTLLVGAPKATYDNRMEGGVFECPFINGSQCSMIDKFNFRNNTNPNPFSRVDDIDNDAAFDGQLLGFSVNSLHNQVVACAPLFLDSFRQFGSYHISDINGRCVMFPQDLNSSVPLQISVDEINGLSLGGVDTTFFRPTTSVSQLAIGSIYSGDTHAGRIFSFDYNNLNSAQNYVSDNDPTVLYELRGYHLERGHFSVDLNDNIEEIFSSAPRASQHKGKIMILRPEPGRRLRSSMSIDGPEPDSYFGYDFALLDLQTNGYDSIVVGCPLCNRNRGKVYVYIHSGNHMAPILKTQIIEAPSQLRGQFGLAVETLGDINYDGYDDVAISAPYIDNGVVYIFRGSKDGLVTTDYQVIPARPGMVGFGLVLTAGTDVDDNGYPDLTASDLMGSQIVTIRSSPIVNVDVSLKEKELRINYADRNCRVGDEILVCFNITPCFNFTTVFGEVQTFAIKYKLLVDDEVRRVGLVNDPVTNKVIEEVTLLSGPMRTCASSHKFVLQPDFSNTDPFPLELTISDVDEPLPLSSPDSIQFGGPLHPVLNHDTDASKFQDMIIPEFKVNCGNDNVCNPVYNINVSLEGNIDVIPLAAAYEFSFSITLENEVDDSLAAFLSIIIPPGILFAGSESLTGFAFSICEVVSTQNIKCSLKNPIVAGEIVKLRLSFRPNVRQIAFDLRSLIFNFTVGDTNHTFPLAETSIIIPTDSIATYNIRSSFGNETVQATRILPSVDVSNATLNLLGPTLTYQVTISNTKANNRGSPIPRTSLTITWPAQITLSGQQQPLLVLTGLAVVGSNSTTCAQRNAIPYNLLTSQQQQRFLPNISHSIPIRNCPSSSNITCGIIQCNITHISAQPSDNTSVVTPVQISIFSTLWSLSVRESFNISVYAKVESETEYPKLTSDSITEMTSRIGVFPAVEEIMTECLQPWIIAIAVVGALLAVLVLVLLLALCGFIGHSQFKKKKEEDMRKRWRELQEVDGSLGARIIPPPGTFSIDKAKEKEYEADMELKELQMQNNSQQLQSTEPEHELGPITDPEETDPIDSNPLEGFSATLGIGGLEDETEI